MSGFLHIGFPKCFSTTLQKEYFNNHEDIFYGGIGINSNIDFYNDELNLLFESGLIYYRNNRYFSNEIRFKKTVNSFVEKAFRSNKKAWGFSSEHLLFNFTPQTIDINEKLRRIHHLFGSKIKIILILREQFSLIKSLFKEYVNMGYRHSFHDFCLWLYKYQDRNFYDDLKYYSVITSIHEKFNPEQVRILFFEDYKSNEGSLKNSLTKDISEFLGISSGPKIGKNRNPSVEDESIPLRLLINDKVPFDFGDTLLSGIEDHRRRIFFNKELELDLTEKELFESVLKKRENHALLKESNSINSPAPIFQMDKKVFNKMDNDFTEDQRHLRDSLGIDIVSKFEEQKLRTISSWHFV